MKHYIVSIMIVLGISASISLAGPGDLDTTFGGTGKIRFGLKRGDDRATATAKQSDGKVIVVGSTPNGDTDFLVARYNTDGSLDATFGNGGLVMTHFGRGEDYATGVAINPSNGKIVVVGGCAGENEDVCLARYNTDGSLDSNFGLGGKVVTPVTTSWDKAKGVAIQPDGKIVVVGDSRTTNTSLDFLVLRYNANGALDNGFGQSNSGKIVLNVVGNGDDTADAVIVQADGKIVVVGTGYPFTSPAFLIVARFTSTGSADNTWGILGGISQFRFTDTGQHESRAVTIQPDGKVLMAGIADSKFLLVRFTLTGFFDNSFNGNGIRMTSLGGTSDEARSVTVENNMIIAGGHATIGGRKNNVIARYTMAGAPDQLFGGGSGKVLVPVGQTDSQINGVTTQNGGIVAVGSSHNATNEDFTVMRVNGNGILDTGFAGTGIRTDDPGTRFAWARGMVIQPDGKILVAGTTGTDLTGSDFAVARFNPNGTLDPNFGSGGRVSIDFGENDEQGNAIALAPDGRIVVAGKRLDPQANKYDFAVARLNASGSLDETFNQTGKLVFPVGVLSDEANGVAVQQDGKIIVVGTIEVGAQRDFGIVRLDVSGGLDGTFQGGGKVIAGVGAQNDDAQAVKIQPDGKIVVVGNSVNSAYTDSDFAILRLTSTGAPDNSFGAQGRQITVLGTNLDLCFGLAFQSDGKILVAGYTLNAAGTAAQAAVVRYGTNGVPDPSFDNDGIVTTPIAIVVSAATSVGVQADGKIVIGGVAAVGNDVRFAAARYLGSGALDDTFGIGGKAIVDDNIGGFGWTMAIDAQGRALIAGDSQNLMGIVRLQGDIAARKAPFDFDADGKTDISIFRPAPAEWWIAKSAGGNFATQFGVTTDKLAPADYTGDGKTDAAFFRPSTGQWFVLRSEDSSFFGFAFGTNGDVPVPADYDGDGKADPAVFRPSNSTWYIQKSSGGFTITQFGISGDQPVVADYDGDGKADIAIRRPDSGQWWLNRSSSGVVAYAFGNGTDKTVQGDYTGDGKADVAIWRPSTGNWFILRSEDSSLYGFPFGTSGDVPAPGDYDGDGKFDAVVYRPVGSTWFIGKSSGGTLIVPFGSAGDQPLPGAFVR